MNLKRIEEWAIKAKIETDIVVHQATFGKRDLSGEIKRMASSGARWPVSSWSITETMTHAVSAIKYIVLIREEMSKNEINAPVLGKALIEAINATEFLSRMIVRYRETPYIKEDFLSLDKEHDYRWKILPSLEDAYNMITVFQQELDSAILEGHI